MWAAANQNCLNYLHHHQSDIQALLYSDLTDTINNDMDLNNIRQQFILLSSYTGGPCHMKQCFWDSLVLAHYYWWINLFITTVLWSATTRDTEGGLPTQGSSGLDYTHLTAIITKIKSPTKTTQERSQWLSTTDAAESEIEMRRVDWGDQLRQRESGSKGVLNKSLHWVTKTEVCQGHSSPSSKQSSAQRLSTVVGARTRLLKQAARIASYLRLNNWLMTAENLLTSQAFTSTKGEDLFLIE